MPLPFAMPLFQAFARELDRFQRCSAANDTGSRAYAEFAPEALDNLRRMESDLLPSGSGFDSGCSLILEQSTPEQLTFSADFHHMNDGGFYDGWTTHKVILRPSFLGSGFSLKVTGRDRNGIKEYIADTFHHALTQEAR